MDTSPGVLQEPRNKHSASTDQVEGTGVEPSETGCSGADSRLSNDSLVFEKQSMEY